MRIISARRLPAAVGIALATAAVLSCSDSSTSPVDNPVPGIDAISPTSVVPGSGPRTITVDGSDFVRNSVVYFHGVARPTHFVDRTQLTADLTAADVLAAGQRLVVVVSPEPGGGISNPLIFDVVPPGGPGGGEEVPNPVPTLTTIAPDNATMGSGDVVVTLTGTNFVNTSTVSFTTETAVGDFQAPTSFVSATQLRVTVGSARLQTAGTYQVRVTNPWPGGGTSAARTFTVRTPAPTASALSHTTVAAGTEADTVFVDGTGFYAGSTVRFNGGIRSTTLVSPTRLRAIFVAGDLAVPSTYDVTVVNPAPGGGTSAALPFQVVATTPTIVGLPATGGTAGRPGFSLAVDGTHFLAGAVVQWNGADRPTTFRAGTRLVAAISAADVASAGTARITVRNPGVATVSNAVDFTVRTLGAPTVTSQRTVSQPANDVVWDGRAGLLYASVPSTGGTYGNSVVAIDPMTGVVTKSAFVGSEPEMLAVSDDGQYVYVALRGASSVRRVKLATFTAELEFSIGTGLAVEEMLVVPGAANTVVLAKMSPGTSPKHVGVFVYDDGVQRATATPGHTGSNSIAFAGRSASALYGYNNETTDFGFRGMRIDAGGISTTSITGGLISSFYTRIVGAGGRVYASNGAIVDPELRTSTGSFSLNMFSPIGLYADPELGRVLFFASGTLSAFDMNTMQALGSVSAPGAAPEHPAIARQRLVHWGTDGVAYRDGTNVYILRTNLAGP